MKRMEIQGLTSSENLLKTSEIKLQFTGNFIDRKLCKLDMQLRRMNEIPTTSGRNNE